MRPISIASALWISLVALEPTKADDSAGDPARGSSLFRQTCFACHSIDADRVGPRLGGIVGRPAGSVPGYPYSPTLASADIVWDESSLDRWLAGPRRFLPGARMPFSLDDEADRRDLIAYLATLTEDP